MGCKGILVGNVLLHHVKSGEVIEEADQAEVVREVLEAEQGG